MAEEPVAIQGDLVALTERDEGFVKVGGTLRIAHVRQLRPVLSNHDLWLLGHTDPWPDACCSTLWCLVSIVPTTGKSVGWLFLLHPANSRGVSWIVIRPVGRVRRLFKTRGSSRSGREIIEISWVGR